MNELLNQINLTEITPTHLMILFVIFIAADIVSGFINAYLNKEVDSAKMREGLIKKGSAIGFIILILVADGILFKEAKMTYLFLSIFIIDEAISILENTPYLPWPTGLIEMLKSIKKTKKGE